MSHNLSYLIKFIEISTADSARPKIKVPIRKKSEEATLVTKYDNTFGRCYSLQLDRSVTALGITKIEFSTRLNIYIYLHHPGQYMDVDSKSKVSGSLNSGKFEQKIPNMKLDFLISWNQKSESCAFANFGHSSGTEEEPSQKRD